MAEREKVSLPFSVEHESVTRIEVTATDGTKYTLRLVPTVFEVLQVLGVTTPEGFPGFEFKATMAIDISKKGELT